MIDRSSFPTLIWARSSPPPIDIPVILWDSFFYEGQHEDTVSLPTFLEENGTSIRAKILVFFNEIKNVSIDGKPIDEALKGPLGTSLWWMSCAYLKRLGDAEIPFVARLCAIEEIVGHKNLGEVVVASGNKRLRRQIKHALSAEHSLSILDFGNFVRRVSLALRAIGSLTRYFVVSQFVHERVTEQFSTTPATVAFVDYLSTQSSHAEDHTHYESKFWGDAPNLVKNRAWLHILSSNISLSHVRRASIAVHDLGLATRDDHRFGIVRLRLRDIRTLLREYWRLTLVFSATTKKLSRFTLPSSHLRLWSVFGKKWESSVLGSTAMRHLILMLTFDRIAEKSPNLKAIYFPMENQPWEFALINSFRAKTETSLIGVAHSTVRFWDLRYFIDPKENGLLVDHRSQPSPHQIVVTGEPSRMQLLDNSYPDESVQVLEALRYGHLNLLKDLVAHEVGSLVILGDFVSDSNDLLLEVCRNALTLSAYRGPIVIRSHPICPLTSKQLGFLAPHLSEDPLLEVLSGASRVITTAGSSSAAEAVQLGIPTAIVLDPHTLNYSPFRSSQQVQSVENEHQLAEFLSTKPIRGPRLGNMFYVDPALSRWKQEFSRFTTQ